ncbi:MAG TPA: polysaccharide biosynthesis/export family protein, partial [Pyrinomonadaceae bacterium]|nr:polysaccharide biosynthesis/export family protein [Pyrinomonadaceae bacterium]
MKIVNSSVALAFAAAFTVSSAATVLARPQDDPAGNQTRQRAAIKPAQDPAKAPGQKTSPPTGDRLEPDETRTQPGDVPAETQANRHEQLSEEAAVVPYYNNFFHTYRLGPEDVISINVFGQERYSRGGITIPPSGRISLALIPGGVFVNGKTVDEVAEIVKQRYDEY